MTKEQIRAELDTLTCSTTTFDAALLPADLLAELNQWHWGSYGWVSPVSLMFTAAWHKYYYPEIDCCRIWAADESSQPIPGGYSIRTEDESISIPLLAKYDLCNGFCSPNSGMQGSRAIEKMRALKRLDRDSDSAQRTVFDWKLFASILNRTNELEHSQLLELTKFFICTAKDIRQRRLQVNEALRTQTADVFDLLGILSAIPDPELTKCVTAACLSALYGSSGLSVAGVADQKTAADARAGKPGDITLEKDAVPVVAVEIKDKTQRIDWNNIERAKRIMARHPGLRTFLFVLESRDAATDPRVNEMVRSAQLKTEDGRLISIMSLHALYRLAAVLPDAELTSLTGQYLALAPAVKPETKTAWLNAIHPQ